MPEFVIPEDEIRLRGKHEGVTHFSNGVAIMDKDKVLIVRRVPHDFLGGMYELPGGGVDEGETFVQAVTRETQEETGLTVVSIDEMFEGFDYVTSEEPKTRMIGFVVTTSNTEIVLSPDEHDAYVWISRKELDLYPMTDEMRTCLRVLLG